MFGKKLLVLVFLISLSAFVPADTLIQSCDAYVEHSKWQYLENTHDKDVIVNKQETSELGFFGRMNCNFAEKKELPLSEGCSSFYIKVTEQPYGFRWPDVGETFEIDEKNEDGDFNYLWADNPNWFSINLTVNEQGKLERILYDMWDGDARMGGSKWDLYCVECKCDSGLCCAGCGYKSSSEICDENESIDFGCPWGTDAGNNVAERTMQRYCPGNSSNCDGELKGTKWETKYDCSDEEFCDEETFSCMLLSETLTVSKVEAQDTLKGGVLNVTVELLNVDENQGVGVSIQILDANETALLTYSVEQNESSVIYRFGDVEDENMQVSLETGSHYVNVSVGQGCRVECEKNSSFEVTEGFSLKLDMTTILAAVLVVLLVALAVLGFFYIKVSRKARIF